MRKKRVDFTHQEEHPWLHNLPGQLHQNALLQKHLHSGNFGSELTIFKQFNKINKENKKELHIFSTALQNTFCNVVFCITLSVCLNHVNQSIITERCCW